MSEIWHPVVAERAFPEDGKLAARIGGWHVLVARGEGRTRGSADHFVMPLTAAQPAAGDRPAQHGVLAKLA